MGSIVLNDLGPVCPFLPLPRFAIHRSLRPPFRGGLPLLHPVWMRAVTFTVVGARAANSEYESLDSGGGPGRVTSIGDLCSAVRGNVTLKAVKAT